jgi:hypothetical protein
MMVSRLEIQREDLFVFARVEMARARPGLLVEKFTPKATTDFHGFPRINLFDFSEVGGYLCESAKIRGQVLLAQGALQLLGIGSVA